MPRATRFIDRISNAGNRSPMLWAPLIAGLMVCCVAAEAAGTSSVDVISMNVDNAKVIRLPEKTATVVVGNPNIADVTLRPGGVGILTGKSLGATNLIALDANGTLISEAAINVQGAATAIVSVQRGALDRNSYACSPECTPTPQLGDSLTWFNDMSIQAERRRNNAAAAGPNSELTAGNGGVPAPR